MIGEPELWPAGATSCGHRAGAITKVGLRIGWREDQEQEPEVIQSSKVTIIGMGTMGLVFREPCYPLNGVTDREYKKAKAEKVREPRNWEPGGVT
jgi:hypothetical protein